MNVKEDEFKILYEHGTGIRAASGALSPGVKKSELEAIYSPPSSADVKNASRCHGLVLS
jgi:hypothetical protein